MQTRKIHEGGVTVITPDKLFRDHRGYFLESKRANALSQLIGPDLKFVQTNISHSAPFVLRGMHYQLDNCGKLLRCLHGRVYQVSVDVREGSETFGKWSAVILDALRHEMVWVPPGFANGFSVFEEDAIVLYEMTAYHNSEKERCLAWNDQHVGITWPFGPNASMMLSPKDKLGQGLGEIDKWKLR